MFKEGTVAFMWHSYGIHLVFGASGMCLVCAWYVQCDVQCMYFGMGWGDPSFRPGGWLPRQCLNERFVQPYQARQCRDPVSCGELLSFVPEWVARVPISLWGCGG